MPSAGTHEMPHDRRGLRFADDRFGLMRGIRHSACRDLKCSPPAWGRPTICLT